MAAMAAVTRCLRRVPLMTHDVIRPMTACGAISGGRQRPLLPSAAGPGRRSLSVLTAGQRSRPVRQVVQAADNPASGSVDLVWNMGDVAAYPYVWLRDSCLCPNCYHPSALSRRLRIDQLDIDITPRSVQNDCDRQQVVITWPDGHVSRFPYEWLDQRSFAPLQLKQRRKELGGPRIVLWDRATMEQNLLHLDYSRLASGDPVTLHNALRHLIVYGLLLVRHSPRRPGVVEQIAGFLGHTRPTHYGRTFVVASKLNANNLAYTSDELSPHTDLPFYEYVPGVQMLHCISQHRGTGGENIMSDSFHVAEIIRQRRPDLFQLLSTMPFEFADVGVENDALRGCRFHKLQEHTVIRTDDEGNVTRVCYNNPVRSYRLNVPHQLVKPMYEGLKTFNDLCKNKDNQFLYKMSDGDVLVFNNRRVTHGRLGYTVTEDSERTLEGGYIDWDDILCRYRSVSELLPQQQ